MYSSSLMTARSLTVLGVMAEEVKEAAIMPVVVAIFRCSLLRGADELASADGGIRGAFASGTAGTSVSSFVPSFAARIRFSSAPVLPVAARFNSSASTPVLSASVSFLPFRTWSSSLMSFPCVLSGSCSVMMSSFLNVLLSSIRSCQFFALMFNVCTVSQLYTLPVTPIATMCVLSLNSLKLTGSWYLLTSFLW